jgi:hypothetical protein
VRFDTGSALDANAARIAGWMASSSGSMPWPPRDADVQRRQQHDGGVEVEERGDGGPEEPQTEVQVTAPAHHAGRRGEEAEAVEEHCQRHGE